MHPRRFGRASATAIVIAVLALSLTASATRRAEAVLYDGSNRPDLTLRYVTRDASDRYTVETGPAALRVSAPATNRATPVGSDTRALIWPPGTRATRNHQSCATWTDATAERAQQGIALRVRIDGDRLRTIVVAKNIILGATWQMNVYTWDSARTPYLQIHGAVTLEAPFAQGQRPRALPWRVCARVDGRRVQVKGWNTAETEPTWTGAWHAGSVLVPRKFVYPGKAGWYAGHIEPGTSLAMSHLKTVAHNAPRRD